MTMPATAARGCVVCGAPASPLLHEAAALCASPSCAWTFRITPAERACGICRRPLTVPQVADGVCADDACRHAWAGSRRQAREGARREAREARERREWAAFEATWLGRRDALGRQLGVERPEEYPLARVPAHAERTTRLPARRRRLFREHLRRMVAEAAARPAPAGYDPTTWCEEPPPTPELAAVLGRACGVCRGQCCRLGGERAYVSEETIRRHRAAHPEADDEQVVDAYMAHLATRTYADSCVYHAPGGCTLPRDMRAGICNRFLCDGLRTYRDRHAGDEPLRAFFVGVGPGLDAPRAAFVDVRELRVVRRRPVPSTVPGPTPA